MDKLQIGENRVNGLHQETLTKNDFFVRENNLLRKIAIHNILWIKTEGNYSKIYTTDGEYSIKVSLKKILQQLPEDIFVQIQRAIVVATLRIEGIDTSNNCVFIQGKKLPLGRNYRENLWNQITILK